MAQREKTFIKPSYRVFNRILERYLKWKSRYSSRFLICLQIATSYQVHILASYVHFLDLDATHNIMVFCSYGASRGIVEGKETIALERKCFKCFIT